MESFKSKESPKILSELSDLVENVKDRAIQASGLGRIVEDGREFHEDREAMAGLGKGIQRLLDDAAEMSQQIDAGIRELRERCSPGRQAQAFTGNGTPAGEAFQ